jgi:exodeoxyribonuclease-3
VRIVSWNVNGLRSVIKKGFLDWVREESPDILCLQEIKIQESEIPFDLIYLNNYHAYFNTSIRKGYAGVSVYSRYEPQKVEKILGISVFDREGRFLELKFKDFSLINLYLPHGARDKSRIPYKLEVYRKLIEKLESNTNSVSREGRKTVLLGDFNIAHTELDLARPKDNITNTMFTFPERIQIDKILKIGFIDTFRELHNGGGNYSWWPYYRGARERNLGWRIDYVFISDDLKLKLENSYIFSDVLGSDHCPVGIDINI